MRFGSPCLRESSTVFRSCALFALNVTSGKTVLDCVQRATKSQFVNVGSQSRIPHREQVLNCPSTVSEEITEAGDVHMLKFGV